MMSSKIFQPLVAMRFHPKVWLFVRWGLFLTILFGVTGFPAIAMVSLMVTAMILAFFRDPLRVSPDIPGVILSPADGMLMEIQEEAEPPAELGLSGKWKKIGIFLAPWDVHINRFPVEGRVEKRVYKEGKFAHVATTNSRPENERLSLLIALPSKEQMVCVQIAGFLARRIVCDAEPEEILMAGQKYGIICFGSRVDLYVRPHVMIWAKEGQRMIGGESILGVLPRTPLSD